MLVTHNYKLIHTGITYYKGFEGITRKMSNNSMNNLLNRKLTTNNSNVGEKKEKNTRNLNEFQSRLLRKFCGKLCYYSGVREFKSKKSGSFKFKVAFLTLTAPEKAENSQLLKAFDRFLDYLRRTANCTYIWKKELGEQNKHLHFHILINNFIPYYIISWQWKKCLMAEGVNWPVNEKGVHTDSHYRIELPKNKRQVSRYISKYLSKAYELPKELGYIWGKSKILIDCKENIYWEPEINMDEVRKLAKHFKTIITEYVALTLFEWEKVKEMAKDLYWLFKRQFFEFQEKITQKQKYWYV